MNIIRRPLCCSPLGPLLAGVLALLCLAAGCNRDRRTVAADPGGLPPMPAAGKTSDSDRSALALTHAPTSGAQEMPPGHPPVAGAAGDQPMPAGHPPLLAPSPEKAEPANPNLKISGSLKVADKVKSKVTPGATIFLVARSFQPGGPGQVLAAKKLTAASFPMPFEISGEDVMLAGASLKGQVVLTARVDQDGDAMTKMPGDVEGVSKPIAVGKSNVELVLDTIRTEAAGAPSPPGMGEGMAGQKPPGHP